MINTDIRLQLSFRNHPKIVKLRRRLGGEGPLCLIYLFMFAAESRPDGHLTGMDAEDIAIAADWPGDPDEFVGCLVDLRLLDQAADGYRIHDWDQHQPWVSGAEERSQRARRAAMKRWRGGDGKNTSDPCATRMPDACDSHARRMRVACPEHAGSMPAACDEHARAMQVASSSNAPSPSPSPTPSPSPSPDDPDTKGDKPPTHGPSGTMPRRRAKPENRRAPTVLTKTQAPRFARWWAVVEKKQKKGDAERAWMAINPSEDLAQEIIRGQKAANRYWQDRKQRAMEEGKHPLTYIPLPATWLRAKGWEDDYGATSPRAGPQEAYSQCPVCGYRDPTTIARVPCPKCHEAIMEVKRDAA